ncbi:MAG TPA: hypothetical protein VIM65_18265 [Cyclobacteriaceae bacterium]
MENNVNKRLITTAVIIITALLILNIMATLYNNGIIEENRKLQKQAEEVKVTISQFAIVIIHNLDLGVRGYALYKKEKYLYPMKFALRDKDSILHIVERSLVMQKYPMDEFYQLRDSINAYADLCINLFELFKANNINEFNRISDLDKGYHLWLQYERFAKKVYQFENNINENAKARYYSAMQDDYLIQIFLLVICFPTLLFTAIHTNKKFKIEVRLRESEAEKTSILSSQNKLLESIVTERTREIEEKNKTLQTQYEEIAAQNDTLNKQHEALAQQNEALIESKRLQLNLYTQNLKEKSDMIAHITKELDNVSKKVVPEQKQIEKFDSILNFSILTEDDWERFKKIFQEVYPNFFAKLRYRFPAITASELRLSALIKMNLSLKEAGTMLAISADSVKKSRYRLKKRLDLKEEESLEEFIRNIG